MASHVLPIVQAPTATRPQMATLVGELVIRGIGVGLAGAGVILAAVYASFFLA